MYRSRSISVIRRGSFPASSNGALSFMQILRARISSLQLAATRRRSYERSSSTCDDNVLNHIVISIPSLLNVLRTFSSDGIESQVCFSSILATCCHSVCYSSITARITASIGFLASSCLHKKRIRIYLVDCNAWVKFPFQFQTPTGTSLNRTTWKHTASRSVGRPSMEHS